MAFTGWALLVTWCAIGIAGWVIFMRAGWADFSTLRRDPVAAAMSLFSILIAMPCGPIALAVGIGERRYTRWAAAEREYERAQWRQAQRDLWQASYGAEGQP